MREVRNAWENREGYVCHHCRSRRMIFVGFPQAAKCNPLLRAGCWCSRPVLLPHNFGSDHKKTSEVVRRSEGRRIIYILDSCLSNMAADSSACASACALNLCGLMHPSFLDWLPDFTWDLHCFFRPTRLSGLGLALVIITRSTLPSSSWRLPGLPIEIL